MIYLTLSQLLHLIRMNVRPKMKSRYSAVDAKGKRSISPKELWTNIDWNKAFRSVKSLQRRIVAAIKENRWGKVKSLQWILTHSFYSKVIAIRRVTENRGSRTSGIDGQKWDTNLSKGKAVSILNRRGYKASPVKRVKIPKDNGKYRMLGIPTMQDRALQALHLLALEPIAETLADKHSYGFRPYRSCHDAIAQCHILLSRKDAPQYILEGDIKSCFDKISHDWILNNIPMDKRVLRQWLKAGFIANKSWYPSEEGTPQGSIISPTLANMVLDGMAKIIDDAVGVRTRYYHNQSGRHAKRYNNPHRVNFVRYADDWIVTANNPEVLEQQIKPAIEAFLQQRGLELSEHKTVITNIQKGFDFLGQNVRKYKDGKLIIKPSKKSVKKLLSKIRNTVKKMYASTTYALISQLRLITKGWVMYHRHCSAKATFNWIDYHIWKIIWKWCIRRHPKKGKKWVARNYFTLFRGNRWIFFGKYNQKKYHLFKLVWTPIVRYTKIKSKANPFTREDEPYFEKHLQYKMLNTLQKRKKLTSIFRRQKGKCLLCQQVITKQTGWHIHHKLERFKGGKDTLANLVMLHPTCHRQVHTCNTQFDGDVPKRAFESA